MLTLDEAIEHCEEKAEELERSAKLHQRPDKNAKGSGKRYLSCLECAKEHRQLAEWLKELKACKELADWLAEAVLDEDWDDDHVFYTEVICRKLTKLGKLKVEDNKYMKVNADEEGSDNE